MDDDGLIPLTDENLALYADVTTGNPAWNETAADLPNYFVYAQTNPELDFAEVGIAAVSDTELLLVLDKQLSGFYLLYSLTDTWLVKLDLYDKCESIVDGVYNNTYGTNCIGANTLKLSGNGTLTVTAKSTDDCGIRGTTNYSKDKSNNDKATTTAIDVSAQLAADGYKVTRSARSDNSDGTFTWTYTVRPLIDLSSLFHVSALQSLFQGILTALHFFFQLL